jgi:hypothetical protein
VAGTFFSNHVSTETLIYLFLKLEEWFSLNFEERKIKRIREMVGK